MNAEKILESLSLKEKLYQMFVLGFEGTSLDSTNINIQNAIKNGLGGVIFFANNFNSRKEFQKLVSDLQKEAKIPLITSIDQEGGLVERTIKLDQKIEYLTPMALCATKDIEITRKHTSIMAQDLLNLGINMDFAPVLDVNTNQHNPIIGIRSFSNNADEVITHSKAVINELQLNNIIPVGKHFPGHGEAWVDSHLEMPVIDLEKQELEETHIKPFKQAVQNGLDAIMVAHVHYTAFDKDEIPASLSKNVITQYLRKELGFDGLIISDDMVMGGIANSFSKVDAIIKGINAGINLFIFRDSYSTTLKSIDMLVSAIEKEAINVDQINESVLRILKIKEKYGILEQNAPVYPEINISDCQKEIDFMATKSITVVKSGKELPLDKTKKYCILTPNKSQIFNYSFDKGFLSQFLDGLQREELIYSLNPDNDEIQQLLKSLETFDAVIFVSYNALFNQNQISLFNSIQKPVIAISAGIPYDSEFYNRADSILHSYCYKTPSLKALASVMINP